jgi:hypothetical protein
MDREFGWDDIADEYNPLEPNDIMQVLAQEEADRREEQKQRFIESLRRAREDEEPVVLTNETAEEAYQRRLRMAGIKGGQGQFIKNAENEEENYFDESSTVVCFENFGDVSASDVEMQVARICSAYGEIQHCFAHISPNSILKVFVQFNETKDAEKGKIVHLTQ